MWFAASLARKTAINHEETTASAPFRAIGSIGSRVAHVELSSDIVRPCDAQFDVVAQMGQLSPIDPFSGFA